MKIIASNNCLICANTTTNTYICIYENECELLEKINKYLPLQLDAKDYSSINGNARCCFNCYHTICDWDKFYKCCHEVQHRNITRLLSNWSACSKDDAAAASSNKCETVSQLPTVEEEKSSIDEAIIDTIVSMEQSKHQNENCITCYFCDMVHEHAENLNEHLVNAHSELIFCCDICEKYLPRLQLMQHMSEHANNAATNITNSADTSAGDKYKCDKCHKVFRSFSGIRYHINSKHVQLQIFNCEICQRNFSSKRVLLNHKRSMHNKEQRDYVCNDCGKAFKTDSTLYTHIKSHTDAKPFQCSHCDKTFRLKHHLDSHMVQHRHQQQRNSNKVKTWPCHFCHKHFNALDNLRKHRKIHDQTLGDFVCHICGVKMKQKRYLRTHMRKVHLQAHKK